MPDANFRILVVDDELSIRRFLRAALENRFQVIEAATGAEALLAAATAHPDLIILDLGLPDMDGIEVTRRVREWSQVPIIIISVREQEQDKVAALDAGADDYLTKPFRIGELLARLRAALRRTIQPGDESVFSLKDLRVDFERREVFVKDQPVALTPNEYELLKLLIKHVGKVLTHEMLLRTVWGDGYERETHILQVNISNLRRKIEPDPARPGYIVTEPGVGYRLNAL